MLKKKTIFFIVILVILGIVIAYFKFGKKAEDEYITATIERGSLIQTVSETGTVKAASEIKLNFLNTGKVANILVKIGDKVIKDQVLAELDYSALLIKEKEAQANLNKTLAGASRQEVAVSEASVEQARTAYLAAIKELEKARASVNEDIAQAQKDLDDLEDSSADTITTYEQAVSSAELDLNNTKATYQRAIDNEKSDTLSDIDAKLAVANTALDEINTILDDDDGKSVLSIKNKIYLTNTQNDYNDAKKLLDIAESSLAQAKANKTETLIDKGVSDALTALNKTFDALSNCYAALEYSVTTTSFTLAEVDAYKTTINTQITAVTTGISTIQTAQQDLDDAILDYDTKVAEAKEDLAQEQTDLADAILDAKNSLATAKTGGDKSVTAAENKVDTTAEAWSVAKAQLAELKAPARSYDVDLAQAALDTVRNQIQDSIIKAPINGTVTKIDYEVGEQTLATQAAISLLAEDGFEIEVDVSEADIAKVNINDPVEITLDAFGDDLVFIGKVYFIEPAETVIQDVIYYKVKIQLAENDENLIKIKSGMTANVVVTTAKKDNVLIMPSRAVVQKNGGAKVVRVLVNGVINETPVVTGMRGDEGMVEVLSGVKEGEVVVTYVKNSK